MGLTSGHAVPMLGLSEQESLQNASISELHNVWYDSKGTAHRTLSTLSPEHLVYHSSHPDFPRMGQTHS